MSRVTRSEKTATWGQTVIFVFFSYVICLKFCHVAYTNESYHEKVPHNMSRVTHSLIFFYFSHIAYIFLTSPAFFPCHAKIKSLTTCRSWLIHMCNTHPHARDVTNSWMMTGNFLPLLENHVFLTCGAMSGFDSCVYTLFYTIAGCAFFVFFLGLPPWRLLDIRRTLLRREESLYSLFMFLRFSFCLFLFTSLTMSLHSSHIVGEGGAGADWTSAELPASMHMPERYGAFIRVTWLIKMYNMTHQNVWHDSFKWIIVRFYEWVACLHAHAWEIWRIHMCDMNDAYVCYDAFIFLASRICICDMAHIYE